MSRQVSYRWRLRKAMADADMFTSTALIGPLAERGITLSASQVHRLVTGTPERLNLTVLAALCDILHVSPADLITVDAADAAAAAVTGAGVRRQTRLRPGAAAAPAGHPGAVTAAGCARCRRAVATAATWPDGRICRTCITRASRIRGRCPRCGAARLLPGLAGGTAICRDCAGITRDFTCCRCGIEGLLTSGKICERCALAERLAMVLDDGAGRIAPALLPLRQALLEMPRPCAGLAWLRNRPALDLLTALATGSPRAHPRGTVGLAEPAGRRSPAGPAHQHRDPARSRSSPRRLRILAASPAGIPDRAPAPGRAAPVCNILPAAAAARRRAGNPDHRLRPVCHRAFTCGQAFCDWLPAAGISPSGLAQAGLDCWHITASRATAKMTSGFFTFAMNEGFLPRLKLPAHQPPDRSPSPSASNSASP